MGGGGASCENLGQESGGSDSSMRLIWSGNFAVVYLFVISASYAIGDVGAGAHEVISYLNGSLGSQYFLSVVNERTRFASCASPFKSAGLVISLE